MMSFAPLSLLVHLAACHNVCRPLSRVKLFALRRILSNTDAAASVATNWLAPRFWKNTLSVTETKDKLPHTHICLFELEVRFDADSDGRRAQLIFPCHLHEIYRKSLRGAMQAASKLRARAGRPGLNGFRY